MRTRPKIFSFFAGSGFLDLGFELNGFDIVYVNEIHAPFLDAYRYSRQLLKLPLAEYGYHQEDVTLLTKAEAALNLWDLLQDARKNSNLIGFIGGSPCPDFSVGGKNRGAKGDNGKLSACYIELICQHKPDFFLFENVKGLYRTKKHRSFFEQLKYRLNQAGYILTERLINALEYGVAQDRDRIILIGFSQDLIKDRGIKTERQKQVLPEEIFPWKNHILFTKEKAFSYPWASTTPFQENSIIPCPDNLAQELTVEYWFRQNDVRNHPNAQHYFKPRAGIKRFATVEEGDDSKKSYKRLHRWRYSPTACYGNNEVHLHPYKIRRISAAEALAIQSLPKEFVLPDNMSLTNMFKTIGNGVPYLVGKGLAKTILDFLNTTKWSDESPQPKQLELPLILTRV
ncbi:MAG: DNA cytosine methyltransferase [Oscillatoria sp. PMC 1068.18]|nr:DNA cytosine methyltransferase [Oscillatoria sp. PMC 1076.18]MEC4990977.1 DNA cytosine methyltransferase [Oscillatoria sp. PMC 1068.18]